MKKTEVRPNKRKKNKTSRKKKRPRDSSASGNTVYGKKVKNADGSSSRISFPKIKPWKVIVGAIVLGLLGMLYLKHVFATQELLREVQQLEREYNQAKRLHSNYRLTFDRMIGPAEIYDKANNQGFINGGPAEKVIEVEQ
ncbi:hypothetical protein [Fodinibius salsisoli]|nr:hypothetical protein [Fodinibius salsisoli]